MIAEVLQMLGVLERRVETIEAQENTRATPYGLRVPVQTSAPASPVDGDIAYADGAGWNPGGGAGFYGRISGAWVKFT